MKYLIAALIATALLATIAVQVNNAHKNELAQLKTIAKLETKIARLEQARDKETKIITIKEQVKVTPMTLRVLPISGNCKVRVYGI